MLFSRHYRVATAGYPLIREWEWASEWVRRKKLKPSASLSFKRSLRPVWSRFSVRSHHDFRRLIRHGLVVLRPPLLLPPPPSPPLPLLSHIPSVSVCGHASRGGTRQARADDLLLRAAVVWQRRRPSRPSRRRLPAVRVVLRRRPESEMRQRGCCHSLGARHPGVHSIIWGKFLSILYVDAWKRSKCVVCFLAVALYLHAE